MKWKTNVLIIILVLAIFIVSPINASMTKPVPAPDPIGEGQQVALFYFEDLSKVISTGNNNSAFFDIPSTITRFDVIEINESSVRSLHQQILAGDKIPVRIRGVPNQLWVDKNPLDPDPEDGILRYCGNLEKIPELGNKEYNLRLLFYKNSLTGQISERNGPLFYIKSIVDPLSGTPLYYVYSTADEKPTGARMDNDQFIVLPSGESKNVNDLSPEEIKLVINERIKRDKLAGNRPDKTPVTETPLSPGIVLLAVGIVAAGLRLKKSG